MPLKPVASFDMPAFAADLDQVRLERAITRKGAAVEAGVGGALLTRIGQGERASIDSLAALAHWAGLSLDSYVRG
ncbi:hypothetical protein [Agromyces subbeticus]|uniref:hypothetical protein n=1 Tax=Agromyces subbeticus TaxID=293890 RepID=UPI0003B77520|nr:hypothetical protein [Agromyces subbeticus]